MDNSENEEEGNMNKKKKYFDFFYCWVKMQNSNDPEEIKKMDFGSCLIIS